MRDRELKRPRRLFRLQDTKGTDWPRSRDGRTTAPGARGRPALARAAALLLTVWLAGLLPAPATAVEFLTNGGFETGDFTGWNVGIRPDRAGGGLPYHFDTPSGWTVSSQTQSDGALSLAPINGFSAFNGFAGSPAGLVFFLNQPFSFNTLLHSAKLTFTFDIVGGPQTTGAQARRFEVWITSMSGHDRAKVYSYTVSGPDANPRQTVSLDIRSALNELGPTVYMLEFREVIPQGDTGPALFVLDNVSFDVQKNCNPEVTCPPNQMVECAGPLTTVQLHGSGFDPEGGPITFTWFRGSTEVGTGPDLTVQLPVGTHIFTLRVTDQFGAAAQCETVVTIIDTSPPTLTCPTNVTVCTDPGTCTASMALPALTVTDSCDPAPTVVCKIGDTVVTGTHTFPLGATTVTCTATDDAGNTATCTFTVTVEDCLDPTITCPANITVSSEPGQCGAVVNYTVGATDNCPGVTTVCTPPPGSFFPVGTTTVTCTATDTAGNTATCSFTVTVNDTQPPAITCPGNITVANDPGKCSAVVNYTATPSDNCPGVTLVCTPPPGSEFPVGTTTVTCTATDAAGNTTTCTFTVTVTGSVTPKITCPANITVSTDPGQCTAMVSYAATVESCTPFELVCTPPPGTKFPVGTTTVTCTVTNEAGTVTCTFTVTVNDTQPPAITCPPAPSPVECPGTPVFPPPTVSDNCDPNPTVTFTDTETPGACPGTKTVTRRWTVTDSAGNSATCQQTVQVVDTTAPQITCPPDVPVPCLADVPAPSPASVTATDNCGTATVAFVGDVASGTCPKVITRTYRATDACGNTATCTQKIIVNDTTPPSITCPAPVTVHCDSQVPAPNPASVTATDNCGPVTVTHVSDQSSGTCPRTIIRTYRATDSCGNTATCTQTITVNDTTPPQITCPPDVVVPGGGSTDPSATGQATATDNCGTPTITFTDSSVTQPCPGGMVITRTWKATDSCGNMATCTQKIIVPGGQELQITCPTEPIIRIIPEGQPGTNIEFTVEATPGAVVTCVDQTGRVVQSGSFFPVGSHAVFCTAVDACGNIKTCVIIIQVFC